MNLNLVRNLARFPRWFLHTFFMEKWFLRKLFLLTRLPREGFVANLALTAIVFGSAASYADYEQGVNAAFDGDYATAYREFSIAAKEGLALAQYNLGILYFTGRGVERDADEAYRWTSAAAEQGHVAAQFNLATLLMTGEGVTKDASSAVSWYSRAAKAGHPEAASELATLFFDGREVERDRVAAHAWASYAVANKAEGADALLARIERKLDAAELSAARRLFAKWQIEP
jgi:TPR repeat protein